MTSNVEVDPKALVRAEFEVLVSGDVELARKIAHRDWVNLESAPEPEACSTHGAGGMLAVGVWLRYAFSDLAFDVREQISEGNTVWSQVTMIGRHTGHWVIFPPTRPAVIFPPSGQPFTTRQVHFHRIQDGLIIEHGAVRDDLSMLAQLGYISPPANSKTDGDVIDEIQALTLAASISVSQLTDGE